MSLDNYYTSTDFFNSLVYANRRIKMNLCKNSDIQKEIPGVGWVPDKRLQDIPCPPGLEDCNEISGHCKFLTKDSCLAQSGDYKDMGQGTKPYLEWNDGKCIVGNFALRNWCENPQSRRGGDTVPGVTNTPPFKYDESTGRCLMTKPYCKYMGLDFTKVNDDFYKETDISIPDCHQTNLQEIVEKYITGKTLFRGFKRGLFNKFLEDIAKTELQPFPPMAYYQLLKKASDGKLDNDLGLNEDYSNITSNNTIVTDIKEEFKQKITKEFKNTSNNNNKKEKTIIGYCDPSLMKSKHIIGPNFGGDNINLYFIEWDKPINNRSVTYGFLSEELEKKYNKFINKKDGKKVIKLKTKDVVDDLYLKRIYLIYSKPDWYYDLLSNFLLNGKLADYFVQKSK